MSQAWGKIWEPTIVIIGLLVMLGIGYHFGSPNVYKDVHNDEFSYQYVNYTGIITEGGYTFNFTEEIGGGGEDVVVNGRTLFEDRPDLIKIRTGRSAEHIEDVCNHEMLHHYFPNYRHPDFSKPNVERSDDPLYRLEEKTEFPICEKVVETALIRQNN